VIKKRINPVAWFNDRPTAHLLQVHSRGVDRGHMQKFASEYMWNADIKPVPGHSFVHLISVASGEYYGPNNNADWFNKTAGEFTCSNGKTIQLDGGLDKYHDAYHQGCQR
jgi:hypothetical protein